MIELINGSWDQTQVYLLDEILSEFKKLPPNIDISLNIPVNIDTTFMSDGFNNLSNKIDDIKPVIVINREPFTNHINFSCRRVVRDCKTRRIGTISINNKPVIEIDTTEWIILHPTLVKTGYAENVIYNYGRYTIASDKLFWLVRDKVVRTIFIKTPVEGQDIKQYYLSAIEEAKVFGLDLSDYYKNKIK